MSSLLTKTPSVWDHPFGVFPLGGWGRVFDAPSLRTSKRTTNSLPDHVQTHASTAMYPKPVFANSYSATPNTTHDTDTCHAPKAFDRRNVGALQGLSCLSKPG